MRIVQKYGGTSVGSIDRIQHVATRILDARQQGHEVLVVVSAMAKETDRLLDLSRQITPTPDGRELDMLLASGEQVAIALVAIALRHAGQSAKSYLAHQIGILTDEFHTKAKILQITGAEKMIAEAQNGTVVIVAGFQGVTEQGDITTLGRGGSDITAVALAAAVNADVCEIYTDVDGVYTADPNIVPDARKLQEISHEAMLEMASLGAKVLHPRAVQFAIQYHVKVHTRSSFSHDEGTWLVEPPKNMEKSVVTGIALTRNEVKVGVRDVPNTPGVTAQFFSALGQAGIDVDMIAPSLNGRGIGDILFTVAKADAIQAMAITRQLAEKFGAGEVVEDHNISKVSLIGIGMKGQNGVASKLFQTLAQEQVDIHLLSLSEIKISCIVPAHHAEHAVRALHQTFELEKDPAQRQMSNA